MESEFPSAHLQEVSLQLAGCRNIAMLDRHAALDRPILCRYYDGNYGVHKAASRGYIDVVEWFLDHGMEVNVLDSRGFSFGIIGARSGYFDILHQFLNRGGSEDALEYFGMNALQRSIFFGESDADILTLINNVEDSSMLTATTSHLGFQACHFAAHFGRLAVLRALAAAGVDPNAAVSEVGLTPFHLASQRGHLDVMKYLYSIGANVNALTSHRESAAHFVAALGNVDLLQWLAAVSVDMNGSSMYHQSILTTAIEANQVECCRWLLEEGGYRSLLVDFPDQNLTLAFATQNLPIARLLLSHGARVDCLASQACAGFHSGLLDLCADFGVPFDEQLGLTAISAKDWEAFDWLISHGHFSWKETAFLLPFFDIPIESFRQIKRRGFDFHILNEKGQNLFFGHMKPVLLQFLVEEGLDPNITDVDGNHAFTEDCYDWVKNSLVVVGAYPQLESGFYHDVLFRIMTMDPLPSGIDAWDATVSGHDAAGIRLLAIYAIRTLDDSKMNYLNKHYPLVLFAAALVTPGGPAALREIDIDIDFLELQTVLEERHLTYLANKCREERIRSQPLLNRLQIL